MRLTNPRSIPHISVLLGPFLWSSDCLGIWRPSAQLEASWLCHVLHPCRAWSGALTLQICFISSTIKKTTKGFVLFRTYQGKTYLDKLISLLFYMWKLFLWGKKTTKVWFCTFNQRRIKQGDNWRSLELWLACQTGRYDKKITQSSDWNKNSSRLRWRSCKPTEPNMSFEKNLLRGDSYSE